MAEKLFKLEFTVSSLDAAAISATGEALPPSVCDIRDEEGELLFHVFDMYEHIDIVSNTVELAFVKTLEKPSAEDDQYRPIALERLGILKGVLDGMEHAMELHKRRIGQTDLKRT